jgi:hypothetical protein
MTRQKEKTMYLTRLLPMVSLVGLFLSGCTTLNPDATGDGGGSGDMTGMPPGGDGGADLTSSDPRAAIAEQCAKLAAALCDRLNRCSPYQLRLYYGDVATCSERVQLTCAPYVELPGSSWTLDRLRACTAGYQNGTCGDYFAAGGPLDCRPQPGKLADGAVCANSNQCKSALCSISAGSGCGTCITPAQKGQACSLQKPCALGTSCASGKCESDGASGDACGLGKAPCGVGLYCKTASCAPVLKVGDTCNPAAPASECDPIAGLYCDTMSRKCMAFKIVDAGQACGQGMDGIAMCAEAGTCSGTAPSFKCVAAAADGAACGNATPDNLNCVSPAGCAAGVCRVFDPATCK